MSNTLGILLQASWCLYIGASPDPDMSAGAGGRTDIYAVYSIIHSPLGTLENV